ncbi:MAG: hypothetical protein ABH825_03380, partial [Candidatus Omnitrophota bacterium]
MRKLLTMISILAMLMNTARVGDWRSAFSGADAALAGRPGYLRPLAMDERNGAEAAENSGRFAQLFFGARSTAKKLLSGLKTSDKASKGADMPRAEVAEEFRGKRHGDFVDWNSLRSPNRDRALRIRNLLLSKGIDNVMFCGGASRSVILDRKMGKDVDVMLTIESNERMETEVEWRALYSIYVS